MEELREVSQTEKPYEGLEQDYERADQKARALKEEMEKALQEQKASHAKAS